MPDNTVETTQAKNNKMQEQNVFVCFLSSFSSPIQLKLVPSTKDVKKNILFSSFKTGSVLQLAITPQFAITFSVFFHTNYL